MLPIQFVNFTSPRHGPAASADVFNFYYKHWPVNKKATQKLSLKDPYGGMNRSISYFKVEVKFENEQIVATVVK